MNPTEKMLRSAQQRGVRSITNLRLLAALCRGVRRNRDLAAAASLHENNVVVMLSILEKQGLINERRTPSRAARRLVQPILKSDDHA